jgi:hypothetical protein
VFVPGRDILEKEKKTTPRPLLRETTGKQKGSIKTWKILRSVVSEWAIIKRLKMVESL